MLVQGLARKSISKMMKIQKRPFSSKCKFSKNFVHAKKLRTNARRNITALVYHFEKSSFFEPPHFS
jgi:hypothetical protein